MNFLSLSVPLRAGGSCARKPNGAPKGSFSVAGPRVPIHFPPLWQIILSSFPIRYVITPHANPQSHPQRFCRCRWTSVEDLGRFLHRTPVVNTSDVVDPFEHHRLPTFINRDWSLPGHDNTADYIRETPAPPGRQGNTFNPTDQPESACARKGKLSSIR